MWETKKCHCKPYYFYPIKFSKLLLLCYLVWKKADKLRNLTKNDAKNTWPCAFPVYSSTGQSSGFVVADKQTTPAQPLLSQPLSTVFNIHRGGRDANLLDGRSLKLMQCCRCLCLKPLALSSCSLPSQILQANCIASLHLQSSRNTLSSSSSLMSWSRAAPATKGVRLLYNTIHPLVVDAGPVYLHINLGNCWPGG